jgi:protein required for attachment to host cells
MNWNGKILIVLFDGEHARFVYSSEANVLHTERVFSSEAAHQRSSDLRSDRPGASFHSDSSAHHALNPRHDPHDMEKIGFARFVASEISDIPEDEFDSIVIAAPSYALNIIKDVLPASVFAKLHGTVAKDLVKVPDQKLWEHLKAFVPPATPPRLV